jgi:hypothetical protein
VKEFLSKAILGDHLSKKICIAESRLHIIPANQRKKIGTSCQYACGRGERKILKTVSLDFPDAKLTTDIIRGQHGKD